MKIRIVVCLFAVIVGVIGVCEQPQSRAADWNLKVEFERPPRKGKPQRPAVAHLWIPGNGKPMRGLIVAQSTRLEQAFVVDAAIRKVAAEERLGILYFEPGLLGIFSYASLGDADKRFLTALDSLAKKSGHKELPNLPWLTIGHSTGGIFCRNIAYWQPDRVLGVIHIKSGNLHQHICDAKDTIRGVPFLAINGELEEYGPEGGIREEYGRQTQWVMIRKQMVARRRQHDDYLMSLVVHAGGTHRDWSSDLSRLCALFIKKACEYRLPEDADASQGVVKCRTIDVRNGWLTDSDLKAPRYEPVSFKDCQGDNGLAFWHFDQEMAEAVRGYHKGRLKNDDPAIKQDKYPAPGDDNTVKR